MEEAVRTLQQQVSALSAQNAALEMELRSQQNVAQGLAELPGAITTVLNRAQAPTRSRKACESHQCSQVEKKTSTCGAKKVENYVSGVFPNVRRALAFAVESQDVVTAAAVALEMDAQLFVVLSALTDSESFDVVMSARGDHGLENWRKLNRRYDPYGGTCSKSLEGDSVADASETVGVNGCHREDGRSRETLLWSTRCPGKCTQSCGGHPHEFP